MAYDIFISYRREDGKEFARQLQLKLQNLGYEAFLDVEELKDGVFDQRIIDAIESSKVFLALLTPRYFCRCADEEDWVRKEIECACRCKIHIVPINIDRQFKGFPCDCPQNIKNNIGQHQFTEVYTGQQFTNTMNYLDENRLRPYILKDKSTPDEGAIIHIDTDLDCQIEVFGKQICAVQAGVDKTIRLLKGTKKIKAISIDNPKDYIEFKYSVPDNDCEELMEIELLPIKKAREESENKNKEEARRREEELKQKEEQKQKKLQEIAKDGLYYVKLISSGSFKLSVIKIIKELLGLDLKKAKELADNTPSVLTENVTKSIAEGIKKLLEREGATIEVVQSGKSAKQQQSFNAEEQKQKTNIHQEASLYDVELISSGEDKLYLVKTIKESLGVNLKEAKDIADCAPIHLKRGVTRAEAEELKTVIESAGGEVQVMQHGTSSQKQEYEVNQQPKESIASIKAKAYKYYTVQDYLNAVKYYAKAAESGDADSQLWLGYFYHIGKGVEKDMQQAVYWYKLANKQGSATAAYNLGLCYESGTGVEKSITEAISLYRKAAEKGLEAAQKRLKELNK